MKKKGHDTGKQALMQNTEKSNVSLPITFNIIGAGKVGQQLTYTLIQEVEFLLGSVYDIQHTRSKNLVSKHHQGTVVKSLTQLSEADITFVLTPDVAIVEIVKLLSARKKRENIGVIVHFSGAQNSEILSPLKKKGWCIAALHPLRAFAEGVIEEKIFDGSYCVLEGDTEACEFLNATFSHLGAKIVSLSLLHKIHYHTAATIASNYLVATLHAAEQLMESCGFEPTDAKAMIESIATTTLLNITQATSIPAALTGPLARGDIEIVAEHLKQIQDPLIKALYQASGNVLLPITEQTEKNAADFAALFKIG